MKEKEQEKNHTRKLKIIDMENKQRQHIIDFHLQKKNHFRESSVREGSQYNSRRSEREKILDDLSLLEGQMLQKQSASRVALEDSYRKLHKIFIKPVIPTKSTRQKSTDAKS